MNPQGSYQVMACEIYQRLAVNPATYCDQSGAEIHNSKVTHCLKESDFHYTIIFIPCFCNTCTCSMKIVDLNKVCTCNEKTPKLIYTG